MRERERKWARRDMTRTAIREPDEELRRRRRRTLSGKCRCWENIYIYTGEAKELAVL